jgi:TPR repeat protein
VSAETADAVGLTDQVLLTAFWVDYLRLHRWQGQLPLASVRTALGFLESVAVVYHEAWIIEAGKSSSAVAESDLSLAQERVAAHLRRSGDDEAARPDDALMELVNAGDRVAMRTFGFLSYVRQQTDEGLTWFLRAANAGDAVAALALGLQFSIWGETAEAARWFDQAVDLGELVVGSELAIAERKEIGGAAGWLQEATDVAAGAITPLGRGLLPLVKTDHEAAERWLREAAEAGEESAAVALGLLLAYRREGEARRWLWDAAQRGDSAAAALFGWLLRRNPAAEVQWRANTGLGHLGDSARPFAVHVSYGSPVTALLAFAKPLVSLPCWLDGLAKLIALIGGREDVIAKHRSQIKLDRLLAEQAIARALADEQTEQLRTALANSVLRVALVEVGTLEELLPQARELTLGDDLEDHFS